MRSMVLLPLCMEWYDVLTWYEYVNEDLFLTGAELWNLDFELRSMVQSDVDMRSRDWRPCSIAKSNGP